ncbi:FUSC family protein [Membranihabitans maritimus]|uniref:FUSC family protein n=1 Tax=Membranihabitans maritimus TaxID=2904244 RepID=UPI001F15F56A
MAVKEFLKSEDTEFAFRMVLGGAIPFVIMSFLGKPTDGLLLLLGSTFISGIDLPAELPRKLKLMGFSLITSPLLFSIISFSASFPILLYAVLFGFIFLFSFLAPFSYHFGKVAFVSNLAIMLSLGFASNLSGPSEILHATLLIFFGGAWYIIFASVMHFIQRPIQVSRRLSKTINLTAEYFELREKLFQPDFDSAQIQMELSNKQAEVSASHEKVRAMLMRDYGYKINPRNRMGRFLYIFAALVDLFDEAIATSWKLYQAFNIDDDNQAKRLMIEINTHIGHSIRVLNDVFDQNSRANFDDLKSELSQKTQELQNEMDNLRDISEHELSSDYAYRTHKIIQIYIKQQLATLNQLFSIVQEDKNFSMDDVTPQTIRHFETSDRLRIDRLAGHFTFHSGYFRYALRVAVTALSAYLIAQLLNFQNPNWALFTSLVILKPGYRVSRQRLVYRVLGTTGGVILAYFLFVTASPGHVISSILFLIAFFGGFSFLNKNYVVASIFFTVYILFLYRFLDRDFIPSAFFRFIDTCLAAVLCIFSIRLLFPYWENKSIKYFLIDSLNASLLYFKSILSELGHREVNITNYKINRKDAQLKMGNFMNSYQRILSEPKTKQGPVSEYSEWILLSSGILSVCSNFGLFLQRHKDYILEKAYLVSYFDFVRKYWTTVINDIDLQQEDHNMTHEIVNNMKKEMQDDIDRLQKDASLLSGGYTEVYVNRINELFFVEELLSLTQLLQHLSSSARNSAILEQGNLNIKYS